MPPSRGSWVLPGGHSVGEVHGVRERRGRGSRRHARFATTAGAHGLPTGWQLGRGLWLLGGCLSLCSLAPEQGAPWTVRGEPKTSAVLSLVCSLSRSVSGEEGLPLPASGGAWSIQYGRGCQDTSVDWRGLPAAFQALGYVLSPKSTALLLILCRGASGGVREPTQSHVAK